MHQPNPPESTSPALATESSAWPIILASASPRRRDLLRQVGLTCTVQIPDVDESVSEPLSPEALVQELAARKATTIGDRPHHRNALVIGCDTLVFLNGRPLGKPVDRVESRNYLRALSGQTHEVISGLCLYQAASARLEVAHSRTRVTMRAFGDDEIEDYLDTGESADKAGGYAIQGFGAFLIETIHGDYSNVVGLPLPLLYELLTRFGIRPLRRARDGIAGQQHQQQQ